MPNTTLNKTWTHKGTDLFKKKQYELVTILKLKKTTCVVLVYFLTPLIAAEI